MCKRSLIDSSDQHWREVRVRASTQDCPVRGNLSQVLSPYSWVGVDVPDAGEVEKTAIREDRIG